MTLKCDVSTLHNFIICTTKKNEDIASKLGAVLGRNQLRNICIDILPLSNSGWLQSFEFIYIYFENEKFAIYGSKRNIFKNMSQTHFKAFWYENAKYAKPTLNFEYYTFFVCVLFHCPTYQKPLNICRFSNRNLQHNVTKTSCYKKNRRILLNFFLWRRQNNAQ